MIQTYVRIGLKTFKYYLFKRVKFEKGTMIVCIL